MTFKPDTQQGATIVFSGLTVAAAAQSIPEVLQTVPTIEVPHLGTTGQVPRIRGDLTDTEEFTVQFQNQGVSLKPVLGTTYTVTITAPLAAGGATAEKWVGSCIVTAVGSPSFEANANELQMINVRLQPNGGFDDGDPWTRTAAT